MDDLGLKRDEHIILTTADVVVKSVPFEAILTNFRMLLINRKDDRIPPKEILLESVRHADPGENAIRDPILTLWVNAGGETRQMILTYPQRTGAGRKRERDEWAARLRDLTAKPVQGVIKRIVPSPVKEQKKRIIEHPPSRTEPPAYPEEERYEKEIPARKIPGGTGISSAGREESPHPYGTFCSRCGTRLVTGSLFCNRCGTKNIASGQAPAYREPEQTEQEVPGQYPAASPGESPQQPARIAEPAYSSGRTGPHREKRDFLSWLLPKKKTGHHAAPANPAPKSHPRRGGLSGPAKKTLTTIGIIVVAVVVLAVAGFAAMNFFTGMTTETGGSPGSTSGGGDAATPTAATTLSYNAISTVTVVHTRTPVAVPSEGVCLYVSYLGSWDGTYTVNGVTESLKRSGEYVRVLEDASGPVEATFKKGDSSAHELIVKIYKNGTELDSKTTSASYGQVTASADVGAATPTVTETA